MLSHIWSTAKISLLDLQERDQENPSCSIKFTGGFLLVLMGWQSTPVVIHWFLPRGEEFGFFQRFSAHEIFLEALD